MTDPSPGPAADVAPPLRDGRYRLLEVLGEGGMAIVYRGLDTRLQVERAIKLLLPEMAARPRIRARFDAEARTMARLTHPHIVAVQDVDTEGERAFLVMEMLHGGTLWGWVERHGPMPPRLAVDALLPVLDALAFAHQAGVVHRDVKPQNVLLTGEGVPKLTDFGIARVEAEGSRTRTAAVMGTWTYMPPEQRKSAKDADPRADVYAIGATLHALVAGEDPPDLFAADLDPSLLAAVPPPLAEVVRGATRYQRDDRYPDILALGQALLACRALLPEVPPELAALGPVHVGTTVPLTRELTRGSSVSLGTDPPTGEAPRPVATTLPPPAVTTLPPPTFAGSTGLEGELAGAEVPAFVPPPPALLEPSSTVVPPAEGTLVDDEVEPTRRRAWPWVAGMGALLVASVVLATLRPWHDGSGGPPGAAPAPVQELTEPVSASSGPAPEAAAATTDEVPEPASSAAAPAVPTVAPAQPTPSPARGSTTATPPPTAPPPPDSTATAVEPGTVPPTAEPTSVQPEPEPGPQSAPQPEPQSEPQPEPVEATPAVAEQPPPEEPAAEAPTASVGAAAGPPGRVNITGTVSNVALVDQASGRRYSPGELPAGEYWLELRFFGADAVERVKAVRVVSGTTLTVSCKARTRTCH